MENTKKIVLSILFLLIMLSCEGQKQIDYYDTKFKKIANNNIKELKLNLYLYNSKLNVASNYIIQYAGSNEKIIEKNTGLILQDSIFSLKTNSIYSLSNILNVPTYQEIEKDILYKDLNNIYYNSTSRNSNFPYIILDLVSAEVQILDGYYIKDKKSIYSYGGINCQKLENVDISSFTTEKYVNTVTDKVIYLGFDNKNIFQHEEALNIDDLKNLPIQQKIKDSLQRKYFPSK